MFTDYEGDSIPENLAVITTNHITSGKAVIRLVVRDDEGDWQFLPYLETLAEQDAMVVAMSEILALDATVIETLKLPLASKAYRSDKNAPWHFE